MKTSPALVSFLTVNYNQPEVTLELLHTLPKLSYSHWEIIVVDNGSTPSELERECEKLDRVKYVHSNENLGFAGGNNLGLEHCQGDFIFLINNDTELPPDFLEPVISLFEQDEKIGAVSPRIGYYHQPETLQYAGFTAVNPFTLRNRAIGNKEKDQPQYQKNYPTQYCHGAAMCVRKSVIDKVGTMYHGYFLYYEELDWATRIKKAGYQIWLCGKSFIWHKESVSTGKNSPLKTYYLTRNRLLFARRNFEGFTLAAAWVYFIFIALPKNIFTLALQREWDLLRAFLRGFWWNVSHAPA
mgnify:CR=1 FL=1